MYFNAPYFLTRCEYILTLFSFLFCSLGLVSYIYNIKLKDMKTTIVKTVLTKDEEILITAIAIKESLSNNYKVYCNYNYTYNHGLDFSAEDTETDMFKEAFLKIQKWCNKNNYTLWKF